MGFDEQLVRRVIRMVEANEYKRRQAAPGVKITPRAFGRDRRMPITKGSGNERSECEPQGERSGNARSECEPGRAKR